MADTGRKAGWLQRLLRPVGEISVLRSTSSLLGGLVGGLFWPAYRLDTSTVNLELARQLYANTHDRYKLGAGFARPIVNAPAGFAGTPIFRHTEDEAVAALNEVAVVAASRFYRLQRTALRDGDVFARWAVTRDRFDQGEQTLSLRLLPREWVIPDPDPVTGGWVRVTIRYPIVEHVEGREYPYTLEEVVTPKRITRRVDGRAPAGAAERLNADEVNPWGVIPLVHFAHEPEEHALWGQSVLEPIEPYFAAYHDLMLAGIRGTRLFANPRVAIRVRDVGRFLANNFTQEEIAAKKLRFADREVYLLEGETDEIRFVTAETGLAGIEALLKLIFYLIVQTSQVPEFVFGVHISSSKASASEQMSPFVRYVERLRGMWEESYLDLASLYLFMRRRMPGGPAVERVSAVSVDWGEVNPKSDREVAETVNQAVQGLVAAVEAGLISSEAATEFLRQYVPTVLPWTDPEGGTGGERARIIETWRLRARLEDGEGLDQDEGETQDHLAGGAAA